jgi:hypothetical protein
MDASHERYAPTNEDGKRHLDDHVSRLPSFVSGSPDLQDEIKVEIINAVKGIYVYPMLYNRPNQSTIAQVSPRKALRRFIKQ